MEHVERLGEFGLFASGHHVFSFRGPEHTLCGNAVLFEVACSSLCGEDVVSVVGKHLCGIEHVGLLFGGAGRKQDVLLGNTVPYTQHGLEECGACIFAKASHLSGRSHVHTEYGVGFLEAVEGELAGLDAHIVKVEDALCRFLYW